MADSTAETEGLVGPHEVRAAAHRLRGHIHRTPLLSTRSLAERVGQPVSLKAESLQRTGAFKIRGALNRMAEVGPAPAGVVTVSAGNHAQAVALAGSRMGLRSRLVMPEDAPESKVKATREYGGEVLQYGSVFDAFKEAERIAREEGAVFVHPFDDRAVIAGQGTVAMEILEEEANPAAVVVPVGGGGLLAGVAAWVSRMAPNTPVFGVEPEGAASMARSMEAGTPVRLDQVDTMAEGLASPQAGERTFAHARRLCAGVVTVPDRAIREAVVFLAERARLVVEPAGAAAVAALMENALPLPPLREGGGDGSVVAILSGANVDLGRLAHLLKDGGGEPRRGGG